MLSLKIVGDSFQFPTSWDELTIEKATSLQGLVDALPEDIKAYYRSLLDTEKEIPKLSDESRSLLVSLWEDMLIVMTGAPEDLIRKADRDDLRAVADQHLILFILSFIGTPYYETKNQRVFSFESRLFLLPEVGRDVMGADTPMERTPTRECCEASDIVVHGKFALAPLVVAILCRPEGEKYDEELIKERARLFTRLTCDVYLEVLSLLNGAHAYLAEECPACYGKDKDSQKGKGKRSVSTWCDRMLFVADDRPSELPLVERMPFYDFMKMLEGKIKRQREQWSIPSIR